MYPGLRNTAMPNLPTQLTSFVGRERELSEARRLLGTTRLLTLTGPGGSGKTRMCIQLAGEISATFPDGVYFVPLAPISDPGLVLSSIAENIGLQDARDRPLIDHVTSYLRGRTALLVLDNFEQLLSAAPVVTQVLKETTDALKLMITSRACLRISGEQEFSVPPMGVPDPRTFPTATTLASCESIKLFVDRARGMLAGFAVDEKNAAALAQIARRLDGLPLAIELAAARVKLLPPEAMLPRLEHSLGLLVAGPRDLPERQQTLRSTIAWSHGLLSSGAQRLLATCSVFRGGADLESIESICQTTIGVDASVLASLEELVDHSLLRRVEAGGAARYMMLETIREYAAERLAEMPENTLVRDRHAATFLILAEAARRELTGPAEKVWLERLDAEHNNIRAAIDWYGRTSPGAGLRLAAAMPAFWSMRGHFTEGRQRLVTLLELVPSGTSTRVSALNGAANLAIDQGHYADAAATLADSLRLSRELHDKAGEGIALMYLARSKIAGQLATEGAPHIEQALAILREVGDRSAIAIAMLFWGLAAQFTEQLEVAADRFGQCIELCQHLGFQSLGARALQLLGIVRIDLGDLAGARVALAHALPVSIDLGDDWVIPLELDAFAGLAAKTGRPRQALRLAGFAAAYSETHDFFVPQVMQTKAERWLAPARQVVGSAAAGIFAEGRQMTREAAVACALANEPEDAWRPGPRLTLTRRELEVATLVATGHTNREIAEQLSLSVRTVDVHVDHILTKLSFNTRTQLAAWAYETRLLPKNT